MAQLPLLRRQTQERTSKPDELFPASLRLTRFPQGWQGTEERSPRLEHRRGGIYRAVSRKDFFCGTLVPSLRLIALWCSPPQLYFRPCSLIDVVIGELKQRNERLSIGVITFYARQREFLEKEMKRLGHADAVLVKTVDAFQVGKTKKHRLCDI